MPKPFLELLSGGPQQLEEAYGVHEQSLIYPVDILLRHPMKLNS